MCAFFAHLKLHAAEEWPVIFVVLRVEKGFKEKVYFCNQDTEHFHGVFVKAALVARIHGTLTRNMKGLHAEKHGYFRLKQLVPLYKSEVGGVWKKCSMLKGSVHY